MNFAFYSSFENLLQPQRLNQASKNTKLIDSLPVEDEKELDDEIVQQQLENFTSLSEEEGTNCTLWKLQQGDYLFQLFMLRLEKRLMILRKAYELESWSGSESIKQIEKQDIGITVILRNLISIVETLTTLFSKSTNSLKIESERYDALAELLLYSDNLEINYLTLKLLFLVRKLLDNYCYYFITIFRQRYPYIAEIFKNEKFYKDTGAKPVGTEVQGDQAVFENPGKDIFKLDIGSVKKEYSDFFSSYYVTQQLMIKEKLQSEIRSSPLFVSTMLTLRLAKNFPAIKNRAFIAAIQCYAAVFGMNFVTYVDAQKKLDITQDFRLLYAIKSFPYPDLHLEMIQNIGTQHVISKASIIELDEGASLDNENRFVEEFRSRYLNETQTDFNEGVKYSELLRYFDQFSLIFKCVKTDIVRKLSSKNNSFMLKLEQDSTDLLNNLISFYTLSINKFISMIQATSITIAVNTEEPETDPKSPKDDKEAKQNKDPFKIIDLVYLNLWVSNFLETNAKLLEKEADPLIQSLKNLYKALSTLHQQQNIPNSTLTALSHVNLNNYRLLLQNGQFKNEIKTFISETGFFDDCYSGAKSNQIGQMSAKIIYFNCDSLARSFLISGDNQRFSQVAEIVAQYIQENNLTLQSFSPANSVLNAFVKKFHDQLDQAPLLEKINYARFCYANLDLNQKTEQPIKEDSRSATAESNQAVSIMKQDIIDDTFATFQQSLIPYFTRYIEEKSILIKEDITLENELISRFPNFQKNNQVRSFFESLFAVHAFRASYFQCAFFQNLLSILSKASIVLIHRDLKELIRKSLIFVHTCSIDFKVVLLKFIGIPKEQAIIVDDDGEKISIIHVFLDLMAELLETSIHTLSFLPFDGMKNNITLAMRVNLSIGDNASIFVNNHNLPNVISLRLTKQLCTLYGLFKTQVKQNSNSALQISTQSLRQFVQKVKNVLPLFVSLRLPQKIEYYLFKMNKCFENNFQKDTQNLHVKRLVLIYLYSAFQYKGSENVTNTNEFIISRVLLGDVDAFHSIKKGIEKYLIGIPQQILKIVKGNKENREIIEELYTPITKALLEECFTGEISSNNIADAFRDLAVNVAAEQEIRKSLNYGASKTGFDQGVYYTKLQKLTAAIISVMRKFKINLEILKILKDESIINKESWLKYQFFIMTMVYLRWWFKVWNSQPSLQLQFDMLFLGTVSPQSQKYPQTLKYLASDSQLKESQLKSAQEQCIQFFLNSLEIRHFFMSNTYDESFRLEMCNPSLLKGLPEGANVFLANYITKILGEISRTGLTLGLEESQKLGASMLFLQPNNDRGNLIHVMASLQQLAIELFTQYEPSFVPQYFPPTDLFISIKVEKELDQLPEGIRAFIEGLKKEISNTPSTSRGSLLSTVLFLLVDVINNHEPWVAKRREYGRSNMVQFYIKVFDVYLDNLRVSPQTLRYSVVNISNSMKLFSIWMTQLSLFLQETSSQQNDIIDNSLYEALLVKSTFALNKIADFLESPVYKEYSKHSKTFQPLSILRLLLVFASYALGKLKYVQVTIDKQLEELTDVLFRLISISYEDTLEDRGIKSTNQLWTPLMRCLEVIFTFQKEGFVRSCIEIRIKNEIYVIEQKRFPKYIDLASFNDKKIIKRDMLEHGRNLRQVLSQLFEGLPEEQIEFEDDWEPEQEILPEIIKDEDADIKDEEKKEGENEEGQEKEEGEVPQVVENENEPAPAQAEEPAGESEGNNNGQEADKQQDQEGQEQQEQANEEEGQQKEENSQKNDKENEEEGAEMVIKTNEQEGDKNEEKEGNGEEGEEKDQEQEDNQDQKDDDESNLEGEESSSDEKPKETDKRKLLFKGYTSYGGIQTSKIVKLNQQQRSIIDRLITLLEDRVNDSYNQAKDKQADRMKASFKLFYVESPFFTKIISTLINKYPLTIPYILDRKIRLPEIAILKKSNIVPIIDFFFLGSTLTEFSSTEILEKILKVDYTYLEDKKKTAEGEDNQDDAETEEQAPEESQQQPPSEGAEGDEAKQVIPKKKKKRAADVIGDSQYYYRVIVDRIISYIKKIIETKNFMNIESCHTLLYGLVQTLLTFLQNYSEYTLYDQFKRILSITAVLIKRASNAQEIFKLVQIGIFELATQILRRLPQKIFNERKVSVSTSKAIDYLSYYLFKDALAYFEKEKAAELEKNSTFNPLEVYANISSNLKQNIPEIIPIRYFIPISNLNESINMKRLETTEVAEPLLPEDQGFEGLFKKLDVIESLDEMAYKHINAYECVLQQLFDYYNKYPNFFAKTEHAASFILCLSHLYVILRKQLPFEKVDYSLLEEVYQQRPSDKTQLQLVESIIYNSLNSKKNQSNSQDQQQPSSNEQNKVPVQDSKVENTQPAPSQQQEARQQPTQINSGGITIFFFNSGNSNTLMIQENLRFMQSILSNFEGRTQENQRQTAESANTGNFGSSDDKNNSIDLNALGYPPNALRLYGINENVYSAAGNEQKLDMLREGKKKYSLQEKLKFLMVREKDLLDKFMQKINAQLESQDNVIAQSHHKLDEEGADNNIEESKQQQLHENKDDDSSNDQKLIIPELPETLKQYLQQNITDFFSELKAKDQRVQAESWDAEFLEQTPQTVQKKVQTIKDELRNRFESLKIKQTAQVNEQKEKEITIEELEEEIDYEELEEDMLTNDLTKNPSIDRILKHKNILLEMVPTFEDDFILKIFQALHIYSNKETNKSLDSVIELLSALSLNPYNAYRIVDLISFLLFVFPRRAKIPNEALSLNNVNALVESPITVFDKSISFRPEVDMKYWKAANYVDVLQRIIEQNQCLSIYCLQDYPLAALEECKFKVGKHEEKSKLKTIPVSFRPLDQLKDIRLGNLIKGQKDGISLNNLVNVAQKWIQAEKNLSNKATVYQYKESSLEIILEPFDNFNKIFFQLVQFKGDNKALYDNLYPVLLRPWNDLNIEEMSESLTSEIPMDLRKQIRLSESSSYSLISEQCKIFSVYLDFTKNYFKISIKRLHAELRRIQASFIHQRTYFKQNRDLDDLLGPQTTKFDYIDYSRFFEQFREYFTEEIRVFKKSLKDLQDLFQIALKEELKHLLDEYHLRQTEDGAEPALEWFNSQKQQVTLRMTQDVRNIIIADDQANLKFFLDLIQFMIHAISYAWSFNGIIVPEYCFFDYPLKSVLSMFDFLYPEEREKRLKETLVKEEGGEGEQEGQFPQLSKLLTKAPEQIIDGASITRTISSLNNENSILKQLQGFELTQLYDIILRDMGKLIQHLTNSYEVKSKKRWVEISNIIAVDVKSSRRLDAEKKIAQAAAFAKFIAKKKIKQPERKMLITCQRDQTWYSSLGDLMNYSAEQFVLSKFDVLFEGEAGIDQGGLTREWIVLALNDILDPAKGLFRLSSNNVTLQPSPHSFLVPNHLTHFRYAGRLIAKGLIEKLDFEVDFTKSFLKHILHQTLYISDLEDIDPDEANNLNWVLENDVTDLSLTFSIHREILSTTYVVDLIPNGRNVEVTQENKKEYVKTLSNFKMTEEIKLPIQSFLRGFYEILPLRSLQYLTEQELGLILSGVKKIDLDDMRKYIRYYKYTAESQVIQWFFEVMEEYDEDQRSLFLFFVTGSFKVPFGGFKNLTIEIAKVENKEKLPVAHTCTKSLDLPEYDSKEILKEKLTISIQEGKQGFHIA